MSRAEVIRRRLAERLSPQRLEVLDESRLHEGHAGAAGGESHFRVLIVAAAFRGRSRIARHRLVYAALEDLMAAPAGVHALAVDARTPEEVETGARTG